MNTTSFDACETRSSIALSVRKGHLCVICYAERGWLQLAPLYRVEALCVEGKLLYEGVPACKRPRPVLKVESGSETF